MNIIAAWGEQPPQWISALARAVEQSSKAAVAKRIGISRTSVSLLLANKYPSPQTNKMQAKVEAVLNGVNCPLYGALTNAQCQKERQKPFIASNPIRVQQYRTCAQCPHNTNAQEAK